MIQRFPPRFPSLPGRRAAGSGLVTAIFLLVVLAGLAVALVSIFNTQQQSSALDERGARAYQAARAGVEWGLFRHFSPARCPAETSFQLPAGSNLADFRVTVVCTTMTGTTPEMSHTTITATACPASHARCPAASNSPDYVQRVVEVQI